MQRRTMMNADRRQAHLTLTDRSSADLYTITRLDLSDGPTRRRSTSQRCDPGSHTPPAHWRIGTKSCGQRTATVPPRSENSTGPMRAGRPGQGA